MTKLLSKPLKSLLIYAAMILGCSIPVHYLIIDLIWIHQVDEHNQVVAESTRQNLARLKLTDAQLEESLRLWAKLQPETRFQRVGTLKKDSTYNVYRNNRYIEEVGPDRYQGLVSYFMLNGQPYSLTVETNIEESYETIGAITAVTIFLSMILLLGFIQLNKQISVKLWKPFYHTLGKIRHFELDQHRAPEFDSSDIVEFQEMNQSIDRLIAGNIRVYKNQKEFVENAAHELQTPLAIVQSKLDIFLQNGEITNDQAMLIEKMQDALSRVSRINKNLLLLAKIENQQFSDSEPLDINVLLAQLIALLEDFHGRVAFRLVGSGPVLVEANRLLADTLLTNLLMNALRHSSSPGDIVITLWPKQLWIANPGMLALDSQKLFKRFSTVSKSSQGSGLGLSIVHEICMRYGWKVDYEFMDDQHIFILEF